MRAPVAHTVVIPTCETAGTLRVSVTVPVSFVTRLLIRAAAALAAGAPTVGHTAVGARWDSWEHEVTVVRPAAKVSGTVGVGVTVSAPQSTGGAGRAARALRLCSATVLGGYWSSNSQSAGLLSMSRRISCPGNSERRSRTDCRPQSRAHSSQWSGRPGWILPSMSM